MANRWVTVDTMADFIFLGSKITADGDCSQEIKRRLLLGRKVMTNLDSILKSRDITLSTKVYLVKAMVFPVVMYGCESWNIKKAERWRIDAFELWCWRRLLRVPWTARSSNQSILKEISPEYSLEGLMLKLKGHLMRRTDSFEKTLMLGKIEGEGDDRGWDGWMASLTQWTWVWAGSGPGGCFSRGWWCCCCSVAKSCVTLCNPMDCSTQGLPVQHQLPEPTQTHVRWVSDAIHKSHPLSSSYPPALNPSQHQGLFKWVSSSHEVAKVLEFQL